MYSTFKVKLLTFPIRNKGTYGMAATIAGGPRLDFLASTRHFESLQELQHACEKARIPALVMGMPVPNVVYELTREQLTNLGFHLKSA